MNLGLSIIYIDDVIITCLKKALNCVLIAQFYAIFTDLDYCLLKESN